MRRSELEKLKRFFDMGKPKDEILREMEPRQVNGNGRDVPEGGISIRGAASKYNIPDRTIGRWVKSGYIPVLKRTRNEIFINEDYFAVIAKAYKNYHNEGRKTLNKVLQLR